LASTPVGVAGVQQSIEEPARFLCVGIGRRALESLADAHEPVGHVRAADEVEPIDGAAPLEHGAAGLPERARTLRALLDASDCVLQLAKPRLRLGRHGAIVNVGVERYIRANPFSCCGESATR